MEIEEHYRYLLGIQSPWLISDVDLSMQASRVDVEIEYADDKGPRCTARTGKTKSNFAFSWLSNEESLGEEFIERFNRLKHADLKVSRAWAIKELFRDFWSYTYAGWAKRHFDKWYSWAINIA